MKLAEALKERADLNIKISELRYRITSNVLVQDGEIPLEDPIQLMKELDDAIARLSDLIHSINETNCRSYIDGRSLTEIIALKDAKQLQVSVYRDALEEAGRANNRARGTEIKIRPSVSISELQSKTDQLSKDIRLLDNSLQAANWQIDLIEK